MDIRKWILILFQLLSFLGKCFCVFKQSAKLSEPFDVLNSVYGIRQCIKECLLRRRCSIMGYDWDLLRCELGEPKNVLPDSSLKAMTAKREDLLKEFEKYLGKCSDTSCGVGKKCIARTFGNPVCVTTDCDQPPTVSNSKSNSKLSAVGSVVKYTCNTGYTLSGSSTEITCRPDGQWTPKQFTCQKDCPLLSGYTLSTNTINGVQKKWCYRIYSTAKIYIDAKDECGIHGGHLVRCREQWKLDKLNTLIDTGDMYFVDGEYTSGEWKYSGGSNFTEITGTSYIMTSGGSIVMYIKGEGFRDSSTFMNAKSICEI